MLSGWIKHLFHNYFSGLPPPEFKKQVGAYRVSWFNDGKEDKTKRAVGFLTFHKELIDSYEKCLEKANPPQPFAPSIWNQLMPPQYHPSTVESKTKPEDFSDRMAAWEEKIRNHPSYAPKLAIHNDNLVHEEFWELYSFIKDKFEKWMDNQNPKIKYKDLNHNLV